MIEKFSSGTALSSALSSIPPSPGIVSAAASNTAKSMIDKFSGGSKAAAAGAATSAAASKPDASVTVKRTPSIEGLSKAGGSTKDLSAKFKPQGNSSAAYAATATSSPARAREKSGGRARQTSGSKKDGADASAGSTSNAKSLMSKFESAATTTASGAATVGKIAASKPATMSKCCDRCQHVISDAHTTTVQYKGGRKFYCASACFVCYGCRTKLVSGGELVDHYEVEGDPHCHKCMLALVADLSLPPAAKVETSVFGVGPAAATPVPAHPAAAPAASPAQSKPPTAPGLGHRPLGTSTGLGHSAPTALGLGLGRASPAKAAATSVAAAPAAVAAVAVGADASSGPKSTKMVPCDACEKQICEGDVSTVKYQRKFYCDACFICYQCDKAFVLGNGNFGEVLDVDGEPHCPKCADEISKVIGTAAKKAAVMFGGGSGGGGGARAAAGASSAKVCKGCSSEITGSAAVVPLGTAVYHAQCFLCHRCKRELKDGFAESPNGVVCGICAQALGPDMVSRAPRTKLEQMVLDEEEAKKKRAAAVEKMQTSINAKK